MKKLLGMLLCSMLIFSACGKEKTAVYETLNDACSAHVDDNIDERFEGVIGVAEDTWLAVYSEDTEGRKDIYGIVRYLLFHETEEGFVLKDETPQYALQNCTITLETPWLGEGKTIEIAAEGFADDPYAEEQPSVEGYDEVCQQENGWFGIRIK